MSAAFGDFLAAASEHLKAAVAADGVDGQVADLPAVARDLHHLVAVMSRYCDDLAPCDQVEASARDDLNLWERAAIDASAALRVATGCLRRTAGGTRDQVGAEAPPRARHLAAAATELAAGRDLLHTHFATDPDGLMRDRSEWAAVVTSVPVTRALLNEIGRWSGQLAPFAAWLTGSAAPYPSPGAPEEAVSVPARDELATASLWLHAASVAVRPARDADPLRTADTELLCAIPAASPPQRQPPDPGEESVTELCNGITISASRLRRAVGGNQERGWWSPSLTSGAWQWMAQAAAVTSHLSELALRSLATRAGQLSGLPVSGPQLHDAADLMAGMRAAWHQADQMWDVMITESRPLPAPAMTEASDLVLRMGRLVWDNPHWTPARSCRAPLRRPAALAPEATAVTIILAAAHQATDALAFAAQTDGEAVQAAAGAGRLYVPTRSLPEGYDVPRPFAPAPADRCRALQEVYREALDASIQAVRALDALSVTTGAPSRTLALARAATSAQSRRRGV